MKRYISIFLVSSMLGVMCVGSSAAIDCHNLVKEWKEEVECLTNSSEKCPGKAVDNDFNSYKITAKNCPDPNNRSIEWQTNIGAIKNATCELRSNSEGSCLCISKIEDQDLKKEKKEKPAKLLIYCEPE